MLHKFERYISKNVPQNALAEIEKKVHLTPFNYQGTPAVGNDLYNWPGWQQRQNVEVDSHQLMLIQNKKRIGKTIKGGQGAETSAQMNMMWSEHATKRRAVVFMGQINHMQYSRVDRRGFWNINVQNLGFYRSFSMLYGKNCEDSYRTWGNKDEMRFRDPQSAIYACKQMGWEVDIVYPHSRYHQQKAYADNFNFVKENVSDVEDDESIESYAYELMQKMV